MNSTYCTLKESAVETHSIMRDPQFMAKQISIKTFEFCLILTYVDLVI